MHAFKGGANSNFRGEMYISSSPVVSDDLKEDSGGSSVESRRYLLLSDVVRSSHVLLH